MGTRHFTSVILNGEQKVCQYGQWDGYPTYTGAKILEFLRDNDLSQLKAALGNTVITKTPYDDAKSYTGSTKETSELYRRVEEKRWELRDNHPDGKYFELFETVMHMIDASELSVGEADDLLPSTRDIGVMILPYIYNRDLSLPPLELFALTEEYAEVKAFVGRECASDVPGLDAQGYFVIDLDKQKVFMNFDDVAWQCDLNHLPQDIDREMALFEVIAQWIEVPETIDGYLAQINENLKEMKQPELSPEETKDFIAFCGEKYPKLKAAARGSLDQLIQSASSRTAPSAADPFEKDANRDR